MPSQRCPKCTTGRLFLEPGTGGHPDRLSCFACGFDGALPDMTPTPPVVCPECGKEQTSAKGLTSHRVHVHQGVTSLKVQRPKRMVLAPREFGIR